MALETYERIVSISPDHKEANDSIFYLKVLRFVLFIVTVWLYFLYLQSCLIFLLPLISRILIKASRHSSILGSS